MKVTPMYTLPQYRDKTQLLRTWRIPRRVITSGQQTWVQYMLMLWGRHYGGDDSPQGAVSVIGRLMVRTRWSPDAAERIQSVVHRLHDENGLRGDELFIQARHLLIPGSSISSIIALAKESDDAAFVERVMRSAMHRECPIRDYAIKRYCDRKLPQLIKRDLVRFTGCTSKEARNRQEWCQEILEVEMYYAFSREMEKELLQIAS